jgi:hypothetical protein
MEISRTTRRELPRYWMALGKMMVNFSTLEHVITAAVWTLMGGDATPLRIMTIEMSSRQLRDAAEALAHERITDTTLRDRFVALLKQAKKLEDERNRLTHTIWILSGSTPGVPQTLKITAKGKLKEVLTDWPIDKLEASADDLFSLIDEIDTATRRIAAGGFAPPLRGKA